MPRHVITEDVLRRRLGTNLRSQRTAAALTVRRAAELAGMHLRHWHKIEAGEVNVTLHTLARIVHALQADPADLLSAPKRRSG